MDYDAINREHIQLFAKRDSRGMGVAFMIVAMVFHGIEISCMSAVYDIHIDWPYLIILLCISMSMFHKCHSKIMEYNKSSNYFSKFLYVPFDNRAILGVKYRDILKSNLLYGLVAVLTGFTWRAMLCFWIEVIIDHRIIGAWEWIVNFFDYSIGDYVCYWLIILGVTLICVGQVHYDYRKAIKG